MKKKTASQWILCDSNAKDTAENFTHVSDNIIDNVINCLLTNRNLSKENSGHLQLIMCRILRENQSNYN